MAAKINFKRGDTFVVQCTLKQTGVPQSLAGWTVKSQVRTQQSLRLVAELSFSVVDDRQGIYQLHCSDTTDWPTGTLVCDIQYTTPNAQVVSTDTFTIEVQPEVTK